MRGGGRQCKQCVQKSNYIKASPLSLAVTWVSLFTDLSVWNPGPDLGFVFIFYLKIRPRWPPSVVLGMESWRTADNGVPRGAGSPHSPTVLGRCRLETLDLPRRDRGFSASGIPAASQSRFFCSCAKHGSGLRGLNALPPLKAENTRITVGVQQPWCCCCSGTDDGPDGGDLHGDDGLPRADGPLHPHLVPHLPGEEGGDEARQPVQGQLRVQDGQIQFQDTKLVCGLRRKSSNDG